MAHSIRLSQWNWQVAVMVGACAVGTYVVTRYGLALVYKSLGPLWTTPTPHTQTSDDHDHRDFSLDKPSVIDKLSSRGGPEAPDNPSKSTAFQDIDAYATRQPKPNLIISRPNNLS